MKGFLTRHKEAIILILLIAAVFGVQHLQIQRKEAQMRADEVCLRGTVSVRIWRADGF